MKIRIEFDTDDLDWRWNGDDEEVLEELIGGTLVIVGSYGQPVIGVLRFECEEVSE